MLDYKNKDNRQKEDFYATEPAAIDGLLKVETPYNRLWEPAAGMGHLSKRLESYGYEVLSTDLIDRGEGYGIEDFLYSNREWDGDIITNPPFKYSEEFIYKAIDILQPGKKLYIFHKLTFLESMKRREMFNSLPPKSVYVFSARVNCMRDGDEAYLKRKATAYCWYVWEKGYQGDTKLGWI